jgi:hypothetical protein
MTHLGYDCTLASLSLLGFNIGRACIEAVVSRMWWKFLAQSPGRMNLSDQAARSTSWMDRLDVTQLFIRVSSRRPRGAARDIPDTEQSYDIEPALPRDGSPHA